jgi:tol-pal system protein YbgF
MKRVVVAFPGLLLSLPLLALLATGCAGTLRPDTSSLEEEVRQLRARLVELQRQAAMDDVELTRLRQRVAELESRQGGARPGSTAATPARPVTEPPRVAQTTPPAGTRTGTAAPSGTSTSTPTRPATPPPSQAPRTTAPAPQPPVDASGGIEEVQIEEADIDVPEPAPQPPARKPVQQPPPSQPPAPAPSQPQAEPDPGNLTAQALYDRGYTLFNQGRFVDAESSFQRFLQASPDSELADNAQYWIGECRYSRNDMRGALSAFREVVERFPQGNKVPDAMLKAGQCLEATGDIEGARVTYREVIRRFPGTAAATVADERRAKLP